MLGFRNIIRNLEGSQKAERVADWISLGRDIAEEVGLNHFQLVSVTIFAGAENTESGLLSLLRFSRLLLEQGMSKRFPLRGAIVHGEAQWDKEVAFGTGLVDGYELEQAQNWIGVACGPDLPHVADLWDIDSVIVYPAPLKIGRIALQPVVPWDVPEFKELARRTLDEGLSAEGELLEWGWGQKIQNTILFSFYLKMAKRKVEKGEFDPSKFYGMLPVEVIELALKNHNYE